MLHQLLDSGAGGSARGFRNWEFPSQLCWLVGWYQPRAVECDFHVCFPAVLGFSCLPVFQGVPGPWMLLLLLQYPVMGRNWKNYLLSRVTVCTITRVMVLHGLQLTYSAFPPMVVWIRLSPTLATPSLGFHPLTFSLSIVKLLIDTLPARALHSCQMPSDIEEYCTNTVTSRVLMVCLWFSTELGGTGPATSPHLPVLSQDVSCDGTGETVSSLLAAPGSCFSWRGRTSPMLFCQLQNILKLVNVCFLLSYSVSQSIFW